jgi:hypothetical protein
MGGMIEVIEAPADEKTVLGWSKVSKKIAIRAAISNLTAILRRVPLIPPSTADRTVAR